LFRSASAAHDLQLSIPERAIAVYCDAIRIEQVLTNIVSNAVKYSPQGGTIRIEVAKEGAHVRFRISDEGVGIPEDELPYIFQPFRRAQASSGNVPGVGLGLSVARSIVEAHHGFIDAQSCLGSGTTFTVSLPLANAERGPSVSEAA
jgi:signal transduction histidine kinase